MCTQQWHFNRENEVLSHQMKGFLLNHQTNQPSYRMKLVMYPLKFPLLCHYSWFNHHYTDKPWQTHTLDHRIGLWENFNRKALYLMVKTHGFPVNFPNKTNPVIGWFGPMFFSSAQRHWNCFPQRGDAFFNRGGVAQQVGWRQVLGG